jgi:hypothetical protein
MGPDVNMYCLGPGGDPLVVLVHSQHRPLRDQPGAETFLLFPYKIHVQDLVTLNFKILIEI